MKMTVDSLPFVLSRTKIIACCLIVVSLIYVSMFSTWEMTGETWGYWYFARVFSETGGFIVPDRSPLYILYLNLFSWIPYPASVIIEYLTTTGIVLLALVTFSRSYLGTWLALFASCIWMPYLQTAEPPVQKLALACSIMAVLFRKNRLDEFRIILSYIFLLLAYLFRQTYILLFFVFFVYDMYLIIRGDGFRGLLSWRPKLANSWPLALVVLLILWFVTSQSPSPWNNVFFTDTQWFPSNGKTIGGGGIQSMNWIYILNKYGTFEGHDFYFTNQVAFGGATNMIGAAIANPRVFLDLIIYNLGTLVPTIMTGIWLPRTGIDTIDYIVSFLILLGIIYGAFKATSDSSIRVFMVGSLMLVCVTVIAIPKWRYMMPMIPVFILAASWYGMKIADVLKTRWLTAKLIINRMARLFIGIGTLFAVAYISTDHAGKPMRVAVLFAGSVLLFSCAGLMIVVSRFGSEKTNDNVGRFALLFPTLAFIVLFSSTQLFDWARMFHNISGDVRNNHLRLLESNGFSMKAAHPELSKVTAGCRGIMSLEPLFLGAFMAVPLNTIYSPWEIPPFGNLENSLYKGLNPDRIDCVLVSSDLATGIGAATNIQIRYQNYIKPYVNQLQSLGAITYDIPNFGQAIILRR